MGALGVGEEFVAGDFIGGGEGCKEVHEDHFGAFAGIEGFGDVAGDNDLVGGLERPFGRADDVWIVCEQHVLEGHIFEVIPGRWLERVVRTTYITHITRRGLSFLPIFVQWVQNGSFRVILIISTHQRRLI